MLAAYEAPFLDPSYAADGAGQPELIPTTPDDPASEANRAAWRQLAAWDKPFLVAFSDSDPITGAMAPVLKDTVPGAAGLEHPVIEGAGHFLQEDAGERLGTVMPRFVRAHPVTAFGRRRWRGCGPQQRRRLEDGGIRRPPRRRAAALGYCLLRHG